MSPGLPLARSGASGAGIGRMLTESGVEHHGEHHVEPLGPQEPRCAHPARAPLRFCSRCGMRDGDHSSRVADRRGSGGCGWACWVASVRASSSDEGWCGDAAAAGDARSMPPVLRRDQPSVWASFSPRKTLLRRLSWIRSRGRAPVSARTGTSLLPRILVNQHGRPDRLGPRRREVQPTSPAPLQPHAPRPRQQHSPHDYDTS